MNDMFLCKTACNWSRHSVPLHYVRMDGGEEREDLSLLHRGTCVGHSQAFPLHLRRATVVQLCHVSNTKLPRRWVVISFV